MVLVLGAEAGAGIEGNGSIVVIHNLKIGLNRPLGLAPLGQSVKDGRCNSPAAQIRMSQHTENADPPPFQDAQTNSGRPAVHFRNGKDRLGTDAVKGVYTGGGLFGGQLVEGLLEIGKVIRKGVVKDNGCIRSGQQLLQNVAYFGRLNKGGGVNGISALGQDLVQIGRLGGGTDLEAGRVAAAGVETLGQLQFLINSQITTGMIRPDRVNPPGRDAGRITKAPAVNELDDFCRPGVGGKFFEVINVSGGEHRGNYIIGK